MNEQTAKHTIDAGAGILAIFSIVFDSMPKVAATLAVIWYLWRFYDTWKNGKS